jgi:hypothetical protein
MDRFFFPEAPILAPVFLLPLDAIAMIPNVNGLDEDRVS